MFPRLNRVDDDVDDDADDDVDDDVDVARHSGPFAGHQFDVECPPSVEDFFGSPSAFLKVQLTKVQSS